MHITQFGYRGGLAKFRFANCIVGRNVKRTPNSKMTLIIFDIDGTLTDTTMVDNKCFTKAFLNTFGINILNQDWSTFENVTDWGITEEIILKDWKRIPTDTEYAKMELEFVELLYNEIQNDHSQFKEIKGASSFIEMLKQKEDITIGFATGGWEKSANLKLKAISLDYGEFAFSSSSKFKKREAIITDAIEQSVSKALKPVERIIYFGDGIWDFNTCEKLGIEFIGIDSNNNGKLGEIGAKNIFRDFADPITIYDHLEI